MTRHILHLLACVLCGFAFTSCQAEKGSSKGASSAKSDSAATAAKTTSEATTADATKNGSSDNGNTKPPAKIEEKLPDALHGFALIGEEPGNAAQLLELGKSLQKKNKYRDAITTLAKAVRTKSSDTARAEALLELAETHFRQGKDGQEEKLEEDELVEYRDALQTAADLFDYVVAKYPNATEWASLSSYMAGSSYLLLGDQATALDRYTRTFEKYGHTKQRPKALLRRGVCNAGLGRRDVAMKLYQQYIAEYKDDPKLKSAVRKVRKYIYETSFVGSRAPELRAAAWVRNVMPNGLRDLRGEVVVLVFFMTGCGHCKSEMPKIRRDIKEWTSKGVVYVGNSDPDHKDAQAPIDSYIAQYDVNFFDVCVDPGGKNERPFRVQGYPAACIIDRSGIVRWRGHYAFLPHNLIASLLSD